MLKKILIKSCVPPILLDYYRDIKSERIRFLGPYTSWRQAQTVATGYNEATILQQVIESTNKVIEGLAIFERDGVTFNQSEPPFPLISALLKAAAENDGYLRVLDFGGALGSSYYQCRDFLDNIKGLRWNVVEQPSFVAVGKENYENEILGFYSNMADCIENELPNVIIFSGVLQYLEEPLKFLQLACGSNADYIVIDRTPISITGKRILTLQVVPKSINQSSYPAWFFSEDELTECLRLIYTELASFDAIEGTLGKGSISAHFKGSIYKKKVIKI